MRAGVGETEATCPDVDGGNSGQRCASCRDARGAWDQRVYRKMRGFLKAARRRWRGGVRGGGEESSSVAYRRSTLFSAFIDLRQHFLEPPRLAKDGPRGLKEALGGRGNVAGVWGGERRRDGEEAGDAKMLSVHLIRDVSGGWTEHGRHFRTWQLGLAWLGLGCGPVIARKTWTFLDRREGRVPR